MPLTLPSQRISGLLLSKNYAKSSATSHVVAQATPKPLAATFTIPSGDAETNTCYRLTAWGYGVQGSTPQGMQFAMTLGGVAIGTFPFIGSGNITAGEAFQWKAEYVLQCQAQWADGGPASPPGLWSATMTVAITETTNSVNIGTGGDESLSVAGGTSSQVSQDTRYPASVGIDFNWAATAGAPSITCVGTLFEKRGG